MTERRMTPSAARGFTLLELVFATAIMAVMMAAALPAIQKVRKQTNAAQALPAVQRLFDAELSYSSGAGAGKQKFAEFEVVADSGFLDPQLATGRQFGYTFTIDLRDPDHFRITAAPAAPGRSGDIVYTMDDGGTLEVACPAGQYPDPAGACVSSEDGVAFTAILVLRGINMASGGQALPIVKALAQASDALFAGGVRLLDQNGDGALTFDEVLRPDILGSSLVGLLRPWTDNVRADLALGIANEQLPAVQLPAVQGNLLEFLDRVQ